jgi:hypothetical protein
MKKGTISKVKLNRAISQSSKMEGLSPASAKKQKTHPNFKILWSSIHDITLAMKPLAPGLK